MRSPSLRLSLTLLLASSAWLPGHANPLVAEGLVVSPPSSQGSERLIKPFTIDVPNDVLTDLQERLSRARFPDEPEGVGWTLGTNLAYLKELVDYWRDGFNWRKQERQFNRFEQFTTNIDGLEIHFLHRRSAEPDALPLVMTHGWPGTFWEFAKVIEPLARSRQPRRTIRGCVPRRRAVGSWLRILGEASSARLWPRTDGPDIQHADGTARLHALRGPGWRHRSGHQHADRAE